MGIFKNPSSKEFEEEKLSDVQEAYKKAIETLSEIPRLSDRTLLERIYKELLGLRLLIKAL